MDVPVSVAESLDAHRAAALVGWSDRTLLRDALAVAVAKSEDEKERYFACFDAFFASVAAAAPGGRADRDLAGVAEAGSAAIREAASGDGLPAGELARMLLEGDRAGVAAAMGAAAGAVDLSRLRLFTQRGVYMRRILDEMGIGDVEAEIRGLRAAPGDPGTAERADRLEGARERLVEEARDLVERNIALYADPRVGAAPRGVPGAHAPCEHSPPRLRPGAAHRASGWRSASQAATRGAASTARKAGSTPGARSARTSPTTAIPFRLAWRYTRVERPKVVAVCDVSGSVAAAAQFLLLLLHSLREVMSGLRAFAFSSHLEDVDDLLAGRPFEESAAGIMERIGFRPTDYGRTLLDLEDGYLGTCIDRQAPPCIVLGDARNNRGDPRDVGPSRPAPPAREARNLAQPRSPAPSGAPATPRCCATSPTATSPASATPSATSSAPSTTSSPPAPDPHTHGPPNDVRQSIFLTVHSDPTTDSLNEEAHHEPLEKHDTTIRYTGRTCIRPCCALFDWILGYFTFYRYFTQFVFKDKEDVGSI